MELELDLDSDLDLDLDLVLGLGKIRDHLASVKYLACSWAPILSCHAMVLCPIIVV